MRRNAFTLVELLVVIGIIVVLVAMLLPSLNRSWAAAQFVACQSNLRQLGIASQMYVNDNHGYLPYANFTPHAQPISYCNAIDGWLYNCPLPAPPVIQDYVQTGTFWPYLLHEGVYHCPAHILGDAGNYMGATTDVMTSYMMNGAVTAYGAYASTATQPPLWLQPAYYFKITQFNSDDALMWETAEADANNTGGWNDGSTFPYESYNPASPQGTRTRHGHYFSLLSMDGHVEGMSTQEYWTMAAPTVSSRNRLYCCPSIPGVANGGAPG